MKKLFQKLFGRKSETVPFYDVGAKQVIRIPKSELSPTSIFVDLQGHGRVYIDASEAKLSDKKIHPPFEGDLASAIQALVVDLADVYPMSYEQWEDGFRTEPRPEREIAGWSHLSAILKVLTSRYSFDLPRRKACMSVLLACFNGPRESVMNRCDALILSDEHIAQAIKFWYEGGYDQSA